LIICESEFDSPDPSLPDYSMCEVDYYAWIPLNAQVKGIPNHGLSLRKNLKSGNYEVFRRYDDEKIARRYGNAKASSGPGFGGVRIYDVDVIISCNNLEAAIRAAEGEWDRFHGPAKRSSRDEVCTHEYPTRALGCDVPRQVFPTREERKALRARV
jgi:hypothetical protein